MIRIDEIYYNIFAAAFKDQPDVGLHWFDPFGSTSINDLCNVPAISGKSRQRIVFWDQEPTFRNNLKNFLDVFCDIYLADRTIIISSEKNSEDISWACDTYGLSHDYYFFHGWAAIDWYRGYNHSYLGIPWSQRHFRHKFLCLNNIVGGQRLHRAQLLYHLYQRNLIQGNLISFPEVCPYEKIPTEKIMQDAGMGIDLQLPLIVDGSNNHAVNSHRINFWDFAMKSFLHVVTETTYISNRLHLTEKTFKPIVLQQPFILVAPRYSLDYLKSYGFKTFGSIWDESYDSLPDETRISAVADLLQEINSWSDQKISQAQQNIQQIVEHNHIWFYNHFQNVLWQEITNMIDTWR